jgi:hypothetical protein
MSPTGRPIPLWLAAALLSATLVGGLAAVWKFVYRPPNASRVIAPSGISPKVAGGQQPADERTRVAVLAAAAEADLPDGAHKRGADEVLFKAGDVYMRVLPRLVGGEPTITFGYFTIADSEWDHGYLTQGVRRILADEEYATELGITPEQAKKLAALPEPPQPKWPEKDRARFADAYKAWAGLTEAEKTKAGEELTRSLKEYGEKRRQADQQAMTARIDQIKSILTERQVTKINPIPRWEVNKAKP